MEEGRKRERNISVWLPLAHHQLGTWPTTQARALTGNQTSDPLVRRLVLNSLSHTSQGCIKFCIKFEHSSMKTIQMIQKAIATGNW